MFEHACLLGCEGIVSKCKDSRYRSGRSRDWVKSKNPTAAATQAHSSSVPITRQFWWDTRPEKPWNIIESAAVPLLRNALTT